MTVALIIAFVLKKYDWAKCQKSTFQTPNFHTS